jgi:hypothetical protein
MVNKVLTAAYLAILICAQCLAQSKYNNQLQPGLNTRDDVARVLGQPKRTLGPTLFEYNPPAGAQKLVVEYRSRSTVIERIEAYLIKPISRAKMLQTLKLPQKADATRTNSEGKLVEYFTAPVLVLTYATAEGTSGVMSLGYYSRELFDRAVGRQQSSPGPRSNPASASRGQLDGLVGTWRLVAIEQQRPNGEVVYPFGQNLAGLRTYDATGHFSLQIMYRRVANFASSERTPEEKQAAFDAYDATFGTYEVNEKEGFITYHAEGSLIPNIVGTDSPKIVFELSGNRLIFVFPITVNDEQRTSRSIYERVR